MNAANVVGALAVSLAVVQLTPQVQKIAAARTGDQTAGLSAASFAMIACTESLWFALNLMIGNGWGLLGSGAGIAACGYIVLRVLWLRRAPKPGRRHD